MKRLITAIVSLTMLVSLFFTPIAAAVTIVKHPFSTAFSIFTNSFGFDLDESQYENPETVTGYQIAQILFVNDPDIKEILNEISENRTVINKTALIVVFYGLTDYTRNQLSSIAETFEENQDNETALKEIKALPFIKGKSVRDLPPDETVLEALKTSNTMMIGGASSIEGLTTRIENPRYDTSNPYFFSSTNIYYPENAGQCTWYSYGRIMEMAAEIGYDLDYSALRHLHGNAGDWYMEAVTEQDTFEVCTDVSKPRVGAVISWGGGMYQGYPCGHVAVVEKINDNGTIAISEGWNNGEIQFLYVDQISLDNVSYRAGSSGYPYYFQCYIYCLDIISTDEGEKLTH